MKTYITHITTYITPINTYIKHIKTYTKPIKTYIKPIKTNIQPINNYSFAMFCYGLLCFKHLYLVPLKSIGFRQPGWFVIPRPTQTDRKIDRQTDGQIDSDK